MTAITSSKKAKAQKAVKKKLTLSLDEAIIDSGKALAKEQGTSLSKMIEQLLREQTKKKNLYVPVQVIEPDPEIGALFPVSAHFSKADKNIAALRDEYYTAVLNRDKVEEE